MGKIIDELYHTFQETYSGEINNNDEYKEASETYDKLLIEIEESLPECKKDVLERFDEASTHKVSVSERIMFFRTIKIAIKLLKEINSR